MPRAPRKVPQTPEEYDFEQQNRLSIYWFDKSYDLKGAAAAIWSTMHPPSSPSDREPRPKRRRTQDGGVALGPVYWMLCGMSIELLLKALIVAQQQDPGKTHKLKQLAIKAGLQLDRRQQGLLDILSEAVIWYGRYPVPLEGAQMQRFHDLSLQYLYGPVRVGRFKVLRRNSALDWPFFDELWNGIFEVYHRKSAHFRR